jgi:hypothetical protein
MKRLKIKQKRYNKFKNSIEKIVVTNGGTVRDIQNRDRVKTKYSFNDKTTQWVWHSSYSDRRAQKNMKSQISKRLGEIGMMDIAA